MAKIGLTEGFTLIPEGTHVFQITDVKYKEDFGKLEIYMQTQNGSKHIERFSLLKSDGSPNEGAYNAFSYFAKTALGNFDLTEIDHTDLIGHFIHIHQLPAVMLGDLLRVAADLCGVGMQLILGVRTDPAVGRHPQALRLNRLGFDHFHRGHQRSSRWWAAIASLRFTQPCRSSMKVFRADGLSNPLM